LKVQSAEEEREKVPKKPILIALLKKKKNQQILDRFWSWSDQILKKNLWGILVSEALVVFSVQDR
jgi:hypothetical protein